MTHSNALEYACPVCHHGLTKKLSKHIERVQKRRLKLLYTSVSYSEVLNKSHLDRVDHHRDFITQYMFTESKDPKHPLH